MSKAGVIMAVAVVVALVGAGAGVYFTPNENDTVEIEIKDLFEVGDKHTTAVELSFTEYKISDIRTVGGELRFDVDTNWNPVTSEMSYEELKENLFNMIIFDASAIGVTEGDEERITTDFGDRDCIVYTRDYGDGYKDVYYVGKNNDVVYRQEERVDDVVNLVIELQKSSLLVESNTSIGLKDAEDIEVGDYVSSKLTYMLSLVIEGVNLPEGEGPVTYDVRTYGFLLEKPLTRDEVLEEAGLVLSGDAEESLIRAGIEIVDTSLGKVKCDVYKNEISSDLGIVYCVSNDVLIQNTVMIFGITIKTYWSYTDLVIVK